MLFASRVHVCSPSGIELFQVHPQRAAILVVQGKARPAGSGKIRSVTLMHSLEGARRRSPTAPSIRSYIGSPTTFTEQLKNAEGKIDARVIQLKRIDERDRPLFLTSVTDCLA